MRSGGGVIGNGGVCSSDGVPVVNNFKHFLSRSSFSLIQSLDLDLIVMVLHHLKLLLTVKEIDDLSSVDLKERHGEDGLHLGLLCDFEHVHYRTFGGCIDSEGLS